MLPQNKLVAIHKFTAGRKLFYDKLANESELLADAKGYWPLEYNFHLFLQDCDVCGITVYDWANSETLQKLFS